jgi:hypothetical protein
MENPEKNFSGIPVDNNSPFVEIVWDPVRKNLAIISKTKKESFHFMPKLKGNGAPLPNNDKDSAAMMPYQQERLLIETFHEYYISDVEEIKDFIKQTMVNDFDFEAFLK